MLVGKLPLDYLWGECLPKRRKGKFLVLFLIKNIDSRSDNITIKTYLI